MLLIVDTDGVRTHDPLLAKQMFYQLNYWPIIKKFPVFQYADPVLDWISRLQSKYRKRSMSSKP